MRANAAQITSLTIAYSTVYSGSDQRKHQSSPSLASVRGIHRWPVNSPKNCQLRGKCFHLMTSSWCMAYECQNMLSVTTKDQSSALLTLCQGTPPADSLHKGTVMLKAFPCHVAIMISQLPCWSSFENTWCHGRYIIRRAKRLLGLVEGSLLSWVWHHINTHHQV